MARRAQLHFIVHALQVTKEIVRYHSRGLPSEGSQMVNSSFLRALAVISLLVAGCTPDQPRQ